MSRIRPLLLLTALWSVTAFSQNPSDQSTPMMPRPEFGRQRERLAFLIGTFNTDTHLLPNPYLPDGARGTGSAVITWTLDSMFVQLDERSSNTLLGNYRGFGMLGYDANTGNYRLSMFNNFGDSPTYEGSFTGDTLELRGRIGFPGGTFDQKVLLFRSAKGMRLTVLSDAGHGYEPTIEQSYTPTGMQR
jgi:hypothetical protein